jgi:hypothetical protein
MNAIESFSLQERIYLLTTGARGHDAVVDSPPGIRLKEKINSHQAFLPCTLRLEPYARIYYVPPGPQAALRTPPLILDMISRRIKVITIIRKAMAAAIPNSIPRCQFK